LASREGGLLLLLKSYYCIGADVNANLHSPVTVGLQVRALSVLVGEERLTACGPAAPLDFVSR
jgi:hypothetical protein